LKRLRDAVGEDLLTRSAHGVNPTPRAEALWPEVRSALGRLRGVLAPGEYDPKADAANFRIAMADATAALFMPPLVAQIEQTGALANLRSLPLTVRDPSGLLERGDADIAVGFFPDTVATLLAQGDSALLRRQRLNEGEYLCVMRRGHPLAKSGALTLEAYCAAHHLLVSLSGRDHGLADQVLAGLNRKRRVVLTVNQYFTAGRVVANSDLLTVLPAYFIESTGYREQLVSRSLPFALPSLHLEMLWHIRNDRSSAHQWLRARLLDAVQALRP
jgi:DNA-binding transcriptional LysR family regulator